MADRGTAARLLYLDNLKWVLIALIIATHAATAYGAVGAWFYVEPSLSPLTLAAVSAPGEVGILFGLGTFMLVAGLLTPPALARKGTVHFLRDRLLRLGLPLLAAVVVVVPAVYWLIVEMTGYPATFPQILQYQLQHVEPGPMWFVAVLLVFTVCYAGWRWIRPARESAARPLEMRHLLVLAGLMAAFNFLVWLVFPRLGSMVKALRSSPSVVRILTSAPATRSRAGRPRDGPAPEVPRKSSMSFYGSTEPTRTPTGFCANTFRV